MKRISLLVLLLLCQAGACSDGQEQSVVSILETFRSEGFRIIYSSDVVSPSLMAVWPEQRQRDIDGLVGLLETVALDLREVRPGVFLVVAAQSAAKDSSGPGRVPRRREPLAARPVEEVVVHSSHHRILLRTPASHEPIDASELRVEALLGDDPMRASAHVAGSASVGVSARPRIRGGRENEALVLYDDVQLFEPYHLRDFQSIFSALDARTIERIDFHTGGFPAQFGDRSSAVVEISPITLPSKRRTELGVGLFNLSLLTYEANPRKGAEWLLATRRSSVDLIAEGVVETDLGTPRYADTLVHLARTLASGSVVSANLLVTDDNIHLNNSGRTERAMSNGHNRHGWIKLEQLWGTALTCVTALTFSRFDNHRTGAIAEPGFVDGALTDEREFRAWGLKQSWEWLPSPSTLLRFGGYYRKASGRYRYDSARDIAMPLTGLTPSATSGEWRLSLDPRQEQWGAYATLRHALTQRIITETGLRWDRQHYEGVAHEDQISPRISILYAPNDATELRLSGGVYAQSMGIHEFRVEQPPISFDRAQLASHLVAGISRRIRDVIDMRIEFYRNRTRRVIPYFDNLHSYTSLVPELHPDRALIAPSRSKATGIELSLRGEAGNLYTWWVNYSHSRVRDETNGRSRRRHWDQPDSANVGIVRAGTAWTLSLTSSFHTGWIFTPLLIAPSATGSATPDIVLSPHDARLGNYLALNVKAVREMVLPGGSLRIELGITNLSNRTNPAGVSYRLGVDQDGQPRLIKRVEAGIPIVPILNLLWQF